MTHQTPPDIAPDGSGFLTGGGEMGGRIRLFDWSKTPTGPVTAWPSSLVTVVRIMLDSRYAMWLGWGPEFTYFYNDAYAKMTLGPKHPWALGRPAREVWPEIWEEVGPRAESVLRTGEATWDEGLLLFLERRGFPEETYHTFSYSPVPDDRGRIGGMLCVVTEDTERTIGERRLRTLRELAARTTEEAKSAEEACQSAAHILSGNPRDLPFVLLYLLEGDGRHVKRVGSTGGSRYPSVEPSIVELESGVTPWPFRKVIETGKGVEIANLLEKVGSLPGGAWPEPPRQAVVLPLAKPGQGQLAGFVVAGVSPRRPLDDGYRGFLDLMAGQIATAVANARAYEEERRRAETLAELDRAKTAFFSNVSHEFRTPLTLLLGPTEDLLHQRYGVLPGEVNDQLTVVHRNALRLQKLVNTLLDFSRIEAGRIQATYAPTDLATFTAELASVFRSAIEKAGIRYLVACEPLVEPVYVDREMWEKVVLNLLSNAFKFTLEGEISISLGRAGALARLTVRDTGTGIPDEQLPHVFERFHRVEGARARTHEGTGIGLALVRELVTLHGGSVGVQSTFGQGTTFLVDIPFGTAHLPPDRIDVGRPLVPASLGTRPFLVEAERWLPPGDSRVTAGQGDGATEGAGAFSNAPALPHLPVSPSPARPRILLADDNADMRDYVCRLLSQCYEVETVRDGEAALGAVRQRLPDLVLSDVMMPLLDGLALLRALRADPRTSELPVILLSARAGEESRVDGMAAGADDYLVKPFSARELMARVGAHLELTRVRREAARREQELRGQAEAARERLERVLASVNDQFFTLDEAWRFTYVNDRVPQTTGKSRELLLGHVIWDVFPETVGTAFEHEIRRAAREGVAVSFEYRHPTWNRWFENHVYPSAEGATVFATEITARKRAEEALREADRRKDEFLATLAHELRNPLAPLRNSLNILRLTGGHGASAEQVHEVMERQLGHLVRLVDDLLEVSRITRGKIELRTEPVELATVIRSAVETSRPFFDASRHQLSVRLPAEPLHLQADPVRLAQVFANLLNNAAKYTEDGGRIWLTALESRSRSGSPGEVVVSIRDTGIGIAADMLPRVFDIFTQADRSVGRSQGGLGIGLALVRSLVQLHGGSVEARSDGPDRGSEFLVRLPLLSRSGVPTSEVGERKPSALLPLCILIVDDNRDAALSLGTLLGHLGSDVQVAHDGPTALDVLNARRPEVVLLDIGMPGMNGYEVARRVRQNPDFGSVTLIALTGWGQEDDRRQTSEAGFDHHLVKPVDLDVLEELLNSVVRKGRRGE